METLPNRASDAGPLRNNRGRFVELGDEWPEPNDECSSCGETADDCECGICCDDCGELIEDCDCSRDDEPGDDSRDEYDEGKC